MTKKILLVDDSSFMRMVMKKILSNEEIEVYEAKDGAQALEIYQNVQPDLVTLDITMPDKSGLDVLVEMRQYDPNAKIVMCSSMIYHENVEEALQRGAIGFMMKPFKDEAFLEMVKKYI